MAGNKLSTVLKTTTAIGMRHIWNKVASAQITTDVRRTTALGVKNMLDDISAARTARGELDWEEVKEIIANNAETIFMDVGNIVQTNMNTSFSDVIVKLQNKLEEFAQGPTPAQQREAEEKRLKAEMDRMSVDELHEMSERDATFLQQLVTTGLVLDALDKMSHDQSLSVYNKAKNKMSYTLRKRAEDIVRNKR